MRSRENQYLQRAQRHGWSDGTYEILIGIGAILYALFHHLYVALTSAVSTNSNVQIVFTAILSGIVIFAGIVVFRAIAERIKERTTYPRTGFVQLKRKPPDLSARAILLGLVITPISALLGLSVTLGLLILFAMMKINGGMIILSAMFALSASSIGRYTGLPRFFWLAGAILLVGIGLTATNTFGLNGMTLLFGLIGVLLCISGGITLAHYLHAHPTTPAEDAS